MKDYTTYLEHLASELYRKARTNFRKRDIASPTMGDFEAFFKREIGKMNPETLGKIVSAAKPEDLIDGRASIPPQTGLELLQQHAYIVMLRLSFPD